MHPVKSILARLAEARRLPSVLASLASAREELDATRAAYRKALGERDDARQRADLAEHRYRSLHEHAESTRIEFADKLERIRSVANAATRDDLLGPVAAVEALARGFRAIREDLEKVREQRDAALGARADLREELDEAHGKLGDALAELATIREERDRERAERFAAERELGDARKRLAHWEETRASEVTTYTRKIDGLAAEIDRLHRVIGGGAAPLPRGDGA